MRSYWYLVAVFVPMFLMSNLKLGPIGSKTRSMGQISLKNFEHYPHFLPNNNENLSKCIVFDWNSL